MTIRKSLLLAGSLLALAWLLTLGVKYDLIGIHMKERFMGAVNGLILVVFANAAPKTLTPLTKMRCEPAQAQALQRFCGWTLVLAGLGYSLTWLVLPLERAPLISMSIVAGGLLLVVTRVVATVMTGRRA